MNQLLASKQSALGKARAAQSAALQASQERSQALKHEISKVKAQQAAAAAAAAKASAQAAATPRCPTPTGPALGADSGWAIPWAIVDCESGGQNFPPNSAGASGYYQIIPSTWHGERGHRPRRLPDLESRAECGRQADLGQLRAGRLGLRQHRRHHLT